MPTIGTLAVKLIAVTDQFHAKIKKVRDDVGDLGDKIKLPNLFDPASLIKNFGGIAGLLAGLAEKAAQVGIAIASSLTGALTRLAHEQGENIYKAYQLARALGFEVETVQVLSEAARRLGLNTNYVNFWLGHFQHTLGEASAEGIAGEKVISKLGDTFVKAGSAAAAFKRIGLNPRELAKQKNDEAILQTFKAIAKLPSQAQRARATGDIFGMRAAPELMKLINQGPDALDRLAEKMKKFGASVSGLDAAKVVLAKEAIQDMELVFQGIGNELAIAIAPMVRDIGGRLATWVGDADRFRGELLQVVEITGQLVALFVDLVRVTYQASSVFIKVWLPSLYVTAKVLGELFTLAAKVPGVDTLGIDKAAGETLKSIADGTAIIIKLDEELTKLASGAPFKASSGFKQWFEEVKKSSKATAEELEKVRKTQQALASGVSLEKVFQLLELQGKLHQDLMTPLERLKESAKQLAELESLLDLSKPEDRIFQTDIFRARAKSLTDAFNALHLNAVRLAPAAQIGSQQAASIITRYTVNPQNLRPEERLERILAQELAIQRNIERYSKETTDLLRKFVPPGILFQP